MLCQAQNYSSQHSLRMPNTITITDIVVKEVQVARVNNEPVLNILYAIVDSNGVEYPKGWMVLKDTKLDSQSRTLANSILADVKEKLKELNDLD